MKTSKVKAIARINEWDGGNGTVFYHDAEMENGDKISIGKKSKLNEGDSIDYEIIGDLGQHEYTKAKSVIPQTNGYGGGSFKGKKGGSNASFALSYAKDIAVAYIGKDKQIDPDKVCQWAETFNNWLNENQ